MVESFGFTFDTERAEEHLAHHNRFDTLRKTWAKDAADFLARDGSDGRYPYNIKDNEPLKAIIHEAFEAYMLLFAEAGLHTSAEKGSPREKEYEQYRDKAVWAVDRYTRKVYEAIHAQIESDPQAYEAVRKKSHHTKRGIATGITGCIILHSINVLSKTLPGLKETANVDDDSIAMYQNFLAPHAPRFRPKGKTYKGIVSVLTPETHDKLRQAWENNSRDLLARDGSDPKYPCDIKNNKELVEAIHHIFEAYMPAFAEQNAAVVERYSMGRNKDEPTLREQYARYIVTQLTYRAARQINAFVQDEELANALTGCIISRASNAFSAVIYSVESALGRVHLDVLRNPELFSRPSEPRGR